MARPKRRFRKSPDESPRNENIAIFPAVALSKVEREVTRNALNYYVTNLIKKKKSLREMGLATTSIEERIAIIEGGNGLGAGIYNRLSEQMSIGDQARHIDEQRANRLNHRLPNAINRPTEMLPFGTRTSCWRWCGPGRARSARRRSNTRRLSARSPKGNSPATFPADPGRGRSRNRMDDDRRGRRAVREGWSVAHGLPDDVSVFHFAKCRPR
jgi:hypothetical protein